jgi:hypothetical protein
MECNSRHAEGGDAMRKRLTAVAILAAAELARRHEDVVTDVADKVYDTNDRLLVWLGLRPSADDGLGMPATLIVLPMYTAFLVYAGGVDAVKQWWHDFWEELA